MSALLKIEIYEAAVYEAPLLQKRAGWQPDVIATTPGTAANEVATPVERMGAAKSIALFLASPFIGLAYVIAMPFVGLAMLAWIGGKALVEKLPMAKTIALTLAAPFIGLIWIVAMPIVVIGALGWVGAEALLTRN